MRTRAQRIQSQGSVTISNDYIKVVVATEGTVNMGTTGGDPGFSGDENKPLLFGYPNPRRTSFASLRVIANGKTIDHRLGHSLLPSSGPTRDGDAVSVAYDTGDVVVTERITFLESPFSGRPDMALLRFTVRNTSTSSLQAGVRNMLDVEVGNNDSAPFFVPGVGTLDTEREFSGGSLPGYFTAFESRTFEEDSLRAMGLVSGYGMTSPDRFALATWQA